ncbi:MAG: phage minor head protein [Phenylobacterium sp.]
MAPDPLGVGRARAHDAIVKAERSVFAAAWDLLKRWGARLRTAIFGPSRVVDPVGVFTTQAWFDHELDGLLDVVVEVFDEAWEDVTDVMPETGVYARQHLEVARNRLVRVPDSVFNVVNRMTMRANTEGWGADELAEHISDILDAEGAEQWKGRAETIARTEAVGAYNAGSFRGFQGLAAQLGGKWEKGWLATEDDRTRPTHHKADLQRVPLDAHFSVGGFPALYPGDPMLPAQEVINCRCSMLLLRPDEQINYADRQTRA